MLKSPIPLDVAPSKTRPYGVLVGRFSSEAIRAFVEDYPAGILWFVDASFVGECFWPDTVQIIRLEWLGEGEVFGVVSRFHQKIPFGEPCVHRGEWPSQESVWPGMVNSVEEAVASVMQYRGANTPHLFLKQRYSIEHLKYYFEQPLPKALKNTFSGVPAMVFGAGPSLDVALAECAAFQDRCIVIATDSALHALHHYSVRPDFTINIDGSKRAAELWPQGMDVGKLLLSTRSAPDWFESGSDRWVLMDKVFLGQYWMHDLGLPEAPMQAWCNGGYTGLAFARFLGCSSVTLLGMDCASDAQRPESAYSRFKRDSYPDCFERFRSKQSVKLLPGNYDERVPSIFEQAWVLLSELVAEVCADMPVYNITDRGAKLEGSVLVHPSVAQEALGDLMRETSPCVRSCLEKIKSDPVDETVQDAIWGEIAILASKWRLMSEGLDVSHKNTLWAQRFYEVLATYLSDVRVSGFYDLLARYFVAEYPNPLLISLEEAEALYAEVNALVEVTERSSLKEG